MLNRQGIHARPSAAFVKLAAQFRSEVFLEKDGETINGKSIMGLLMLAAGPGFEAPDRVPGGRCPGGQWSGWSSW